MSGSSRTRAAGALAAWAVMTACLARKPEPTPSPTRGFPLTLAEAQVAATSGRYADAERGLVQFERAFAGTPEAVESAYWRALLRLDPANRDASTRDAIALLDAYLKSPLAAHRAEAATLRRVAAQRESLVRELDAAREAAARVVAPAPAAAPPKQDEEIQRLRDSLSRTTSELERIKRRLAAPRP